jgi:hypothetical protein
MLQRMGLLARLLLLPGRFVTRFVVLLLLRLGCFVTRFGTRIIVCHVVAQVRVIVERAEVVANVRVLVKFFTGWFFLLAGLLT